MNTTEYLNRSRIFRQISSGPYGRHAGSFASRLVEDGLRPHGTWRALNLFRDLMRWAEANELAVTDLNEFAIDTFLDARAVRQSIQPGDHAAMARLLSAL